MRATINRHKGMTDMITKFDIQYKIFVLLRGTQFLENEGTLNPSTTRC